MESRLCSLFARGAWVCVYLTLACGSAGCGDHGLFPTTVDPGSDFAVADIVFDEKYFYCKVEPVLFANSCGSGDPSKGDPSGGCHFSVTEYRLTDYMPRVAQSCNGGLVPAATNYPEAAQRNYQTSQARMKRNPDLAPLLQRPLFVHLHPRKIFDANSPDADVIRKWATQYSTQ